MAFNLQKNRENGMSMTMEKAKKKRIQLTNRLLDRMVLQNRDGQPSLIDRFLKIAEERLESADPEEVDKGMKNVLEILPYVVSKEKSPTLIINNDNRKVNGGAVVTTQLQQMEDYFKKREMRMLNKLDPAEIFEDVESPESKISELPKTSHKLRLDLEEDE